MRDVSQNGEATIIANIFGSFIGRFLEIGACDGLLVSNTLALCEAGWSGIMVEPSPKAFTALKDRHGNNPKLTLVHAAIGPRFGMSKFWESETVDGYNTTEEGNRAKWQHLAGFPPQPYYVPLIPVEVLLAEFQGPIDFLSIDKEGTSTDLFLLFPFAAVLPKVVCVEHDGRISECLAQARLWNYREVARNGENLVIVQGN
jgi:FkbM family methyltransferase